VLQAMAEMVAAMMMVQSRQHGAAMAGAATAGERAGSHCTALMPSLCQLVYIGFAVVVQSLKH
jgi:hypothetical protein